MAGKRSKNAVTEQAVALAEYAAKALVAVKQRRIKTKPVERLPLDEDERAIVASVPGIPAKLKKKLAKNDAAFSIAEVAGIMLAEAESLVDAEPPQQTVLLEIGNKLADCLYRNIAVSDLAAKTKKLKPTDTVYQFKVTLLGIKPPIWRRIQVKDCTLDKLHEHIQCSMGWRNSHLYVFRIGEQHYGDPLLVQEDMEPKCEDSTTTLLSDIMPRDRKRLRVVYEYDFGDGWEHEVLFEGCPKPEPGGRYPICLEGERACPPEDVGGVSGYADFLKAIQDRDHEEREGMLEWERGWFDGEDFDPVVATKSMKKGLPDWRRMG